MFEDLNEEDKKVVKIILENSGKEILNEAPTVSGTSYAPDVVIPLVSYIQKEIVGKELVDVQPISYKEGKIFGLRIEDASGNVISGIEAVGDFNELFSDVSENVDLNELVLKLSEATASVKTRKVKLSYSAELSQDLEVVKYNLEKSKLDIIGTEIATGIDYDIIEAIKSHSDYYTPIEYTWSNNGTESYHNPLRELQVAIMTAAGNIAAATRKGLANFVIVPVKLQAVISAIPAFTPDTDPKLSPLAKIGKLGYLDVYVNTFDTTTYDMYVGKKPIAEIGAGIVFSPYKIEATTPVTNVNNFSINQAIFSRYAITKLEGGNTFYHKVFLTDPPTNFPYE